MKNNRGVSIISFILVICILAVIAFLGYQIFYEDILFLPLLFVNIFLLFNEYFLIKTCMFYIMCC